MAAAPAAAPAKARGLVSCYPSPGGLEKAATTVPTSPRPPPLTVSVCKGRGTSRGREGAPPLLWGRRCGRSCRRCCCCHCQVTSEKEAVAAAANMFSVRIVTADYYMASPLQGLDICQSPLTQAPVKKVPVVRVFGATPAGKRARGAGGSGAPGLPSPPRTRAHAPALSLELCRVSLPFVLVFPRVRDKRRKNVDPRERCCPRRGGGGRLVFTLRAAAGSKTRTLGSLAGEMSSRDDGSGPGGWARWPHHVLRGRVAGPRF